jgi:hypothetical protein
MTTTTLDRQIHLSFASLRAFNDALEASGLVSPMPDPVEARKPTERRPRRKKQPAVHRGCPND